MNTFSRLKSLRFFTAESINVLVWNKNLELDFYSADLDADADTLLLIVGVVISRCSFWLIEKLFFLFLC